MKNAFYFTLKALSVLKIFKFCLDVLGMYKKQLDLKYKVNFKVSTAWLTKNCITHITQYLTK